MSDEPDGILADWVLTEGGRIAAAGSGPPPAGAIALPGAVLAPGFVDVQVNGYGDVDFARADAAGIARALRAMAHDGVGACLPTLCTAPLDSYDPVLERIEAAALADDGAAVLGVHLEGPFLGGAPGAHPVGLIRAADPGWLAGLLDRHPIVRMVTLAPEADADGAATRMLVARGVVVAIGHSDAPMHEAGRMADAGATVVTHLFNGMSGLHHREPGIAAAALDDARLVPTLIADLVHVHPVMVRLAVRLRPDLALVTDAVATAGCGDLAIEVRDGAGRLADGTLAGSVLTMAGAVEQVVGLGVPLGEAVAMATRAPARILGDGTRGSLAPGGPADLVALDPRTGALRGVWRRGVPVARPGAGA